MMEVFRGWKRKVGFCTLLMACVFSACWFRSYSTNDTISLPVGGTTYLQVASSNQRLMFGFVLMTTIDGDGIERLPLWIANPTEFAGVGRQQWRIATFGDRHVDKFFDKSLSNIGRGRMWLLIRNRSSQFSIDYKYVATLYWWFVLPLTLLSAWLLLSKPRRSTQTKIAEPIRDEGGAAS